jgi:hypothetical protein
MCCSSVIGTTLRSCGWAGLLPATRGGHIPRKSAMTVRSRVPVSAAHVTPGAVSTEGRPRSPVTTGDGDPLSAHTSSSLDALLQTPSLRNNTGISSTVVSHRGSVSSGSAVSNVSISGLSSTQGSAAVRYGWRPTARQGSARRGRGTAGAPTGRDRRSDRSTPSQVSSAVSQ